MTPRDRLLMEMNMTGKFHAKHWLNPDTRTRYAEYKGAIFVWIPEKDLYDYCDYECKEN